MSSKVSHKYYSVDTKFQGRTRFKLGKMSNCLKCHIYMFIVWQMYLYQLEYNQSSTITNSCCRQTFETGDNTFIFLLTCSCVSLSRSTISSEVEFDKFKLRCIRLFLIRYIFFFNWLYLELGIGTTSSTLAQHSINDSWTSVVS